MKRIVLIILCITPLLQAEPEYRSALELMKVFTNPSQKADKDFEYWIKQLSYHVTHKERFAIFEEHLRGCLKADSSQDAFNVFRHHKNLFHPSLQVELFKMGLPKVKAAFSKRLAQHKHLAATSETNPYFFVYVWRILKDAHPTIGTQALECEQSKEFTLLNDLLKKIHAFTPPNEHNSSAEIPPRPQETVTV